MSLQDQSQKSPPLPPSAALLQMVTGYWISQAISVAAKLGIADVLKDASKSSEELAQTTGVNAQSLYRLLRALASVGVFQEDEEGRFGLTPIAACLCSDVPGSLRAPAIMFGEPWFWQPWGELLRSVQTGEAAFPQVFSTELFSYLTQHPEAGAIFDEAMTGLSARSIAAVANAYDFSQFGTVVDVGGGHGTLLTAILRTAPQLRGILFDLPNVVAGAQQQFHAAGLAGRCQVIVGNFFERVPSGGDAYILKSIIHDWDDKRSITLLTNCHRAMAPQGKLLLVEVVLPRGNDPFFYKWMDLHLLVTLGGQERTETEFKALLEAAGFRLARVLPTQSPHSIIEAVRE